MNNNIQESSSPLATLTELWGLIRQMINLKAEDFKLMLAQKLTKLLGAVTFGAIALISAVSFIIFMGFALREILADFMPAWGAFLIVAAVVVILVMLVFIFKRKLILDPLARFISRLLFE